MLTQTYGINRNKQTDKEDRREETGKGRKTGMYEEKMKTDKATKGQRIKVGNKYTQKEGKEGRKRGVN